VAGIAGVSPEEGTLGSAHWARYVVDNGLRHEIDRREIPENWNTNVVPLGAGEPWSPAAWSAGTEAATLNSTARSLAAGPEPDEHRIRIETCGDPPGLSALVRRRGRRLADCAAGRRLVG